MNCPEEINSYLASKEPIPAFIKKTYDLLEDQKFSDIVCWSEDGLAIVIKDTSEFAKKVLPTYFKHNKLTSFVRQLNMYNFHKKKTLNSDQVYFHELFQRGQKALLHKIKRKASEHNLEKSVHELEALQANTKSDTDIFQENLMLKKLNKEATSRLYCLELKLREVTNQNQILWTEIYKRERKRDNSDMNEGFRPIKQSDSIQHFPMVTSNREPQKGMLLEKGISMKEGFTNFNRNASLLNVGNFSSSFNNLKLQTKEPFIFKERPLNNILFQVESQKAISYQDGSVRLLENKTEGDSDENQATFESSATMCEEKVPNVMEVNFNLYFEKTPDEIN